MVPLEAIVPAAQNNINTQFILLEKGKTTWDAQNKMCLALVADKTASVHLQLWGEECDAFEAGDIIRMENGIFSYNKNNLVLRAGKRGKIEKLGEFTMEFVETPNLSEIKWVPDPNNSNKTDITKLIVEAIALCSGIEMAHENGWSAVDVESDSLAVVNKLLSPNLDLSVAGYHLQHARSILRSEESFSVKYVPRTVNRAAHEHAKWALSCTSPT